MRAGACAGAPSDDSSRPATTRLACLQRGVQLYGGSLPQCRMQLFELNRAAPVRVEDVKERSRRADAHLALDAHLREPRHPFGTRDLAALVLVHSIELRADSGETECELVAQLHKGRLQLRRQTTHHIIHLLSLRAATSAPTSPISPTPTPTPASAARAAATAVATAVGAWQRCSACVLRQKPVHLTAADTGVATVATAVATAVATTAASSLRRLHGRQLAL